MFKTWRARSRAKAVADATDAETLRWSKDVVAQIGVLEPTLQALSDGELAAQTVKLRARQESGESLADLLPEAFASAREAAVRSIGLRPYDTQIMGAAALYLGKVVEMRTGEGKTLAATMPAYLRGLDGRGVHLQTANEYLAARDAEWMTPVYRALGLKAGCVLRGSSDSERKAAYAADVTYGVASEFAYDYLRDHMAWELNERVQRGQHCAIVDEADLVMVDDARSIHQITFHPEQAGEPQVPYGKLGEIAASFRADVDYTIGLGNEIKLTDHGTSSAERQLGISNLYDTESLPLAHGLQKALEAALLYRLDREYIVSDGEVLLVDPVSGRAEQRTYSGGLQQAIEAKEGVEVQRPQLTLAAIATNEYLKEYEHLAAMTGTASTDAASFEAIYGLGVVVIPTNRPMIRVDHVGPFYATAAGKLRGLVQQAAKRHETGQPVLIGSASIEQSEIISRMLTEQGIGHDVLTAKNNEREAEVISGAARLGAVTVIARMAGRGVDIVLGGPDATAEEREEVANRGGLCVLGAERFANRRLEVHLRGRAGRQGDPGESELFGSLDDDAALRLIGSASAEWNRKWLQDVEPARSRAMTRFFENGQARWAALVAEQAREQLEFDAVLSDQRREIYAYREEVFTAADLSARMKGLAVRQAIDIIADAEDTASEADMRRCKEELLRLYPTRLSTRAIVNAAAMLVNGRDEKLADLITADVARAYALREAEISAPYMREIERRVTTGWIDSYWREHLGEMDGLRESIWLRALGGRSPLAEYKKEAEALMRHMRRAIDRSSIESLFHVTLEVEQNQPDASEGPESDVSYLPLGPCS
ncbi:MAG: preprotein translocase subunit SecA [Nocardiopsaceae bacterium]|jgi:preprotein translocase subunit SecA|nr:preprotein translocase subunit SecA [Nocardiopsaceae bacterium]